MDDDQNKKWSPGPGSLSQPEPAGRKDGRRLRLCCVIGALTTGGSEHQMIGILRQLDRSEFEPHLFTFYNHGPLVGEIPSDVRHFCFQDHHGLPRRGWWPGGIGGVLANRLAQYCTEQKIDVVYDRTFHVALVTGLACRTSRTPYINTIVTNPFEGFYSSAGGWGWLKYHRLRRIYRRAAKVLCVSRGVQDAAAHFYRLPESGLECCYNFIDDRRVAALMEARRQRRLERGEAEHPLQDSELKPGPTAAEHEPGKQPHWENPARSLAAVGSEDRPLRLIAAGRLHRQKGLDVLMQAIASLRAARGCHLRLTLVGDGPEREPLEDLSQQLGLEEVVQFAGWVPEPAVWLGRADLFVLPSRCEGLPNSLVEAMWVGLPAIASDCPFGPAEISEGGRWATLVPPGDSRPLAAAIESFLADPSPFVRRAAEARDVVAARFGAAEGVRRLQKHLSAAATS